MTERLPFRTGIGYDSHRFAPGGPLVLAGVEIAADVHLRGHSDGDAVAHAVTDAVLGAAGLGDIGAMFPDSDPANAGRDTIEMLILAVGHVEAAGWRVGHVDVVVITETPRISLHRTAMRTQIAGAVRCAPEDVSIKGKTNEAMGFIGRGEGLACIATATLCRV